MTLYEAVTNAVDETSPWSLCRVVFRREGINDSRPFVEPADVDREIAMIAAAKEQFKKRRLRQMRKAHLLWIPSWPPLPKTLM
jgi:hypothetical protein